MYEGVPVYALFTFILDRCPWSMTVFDAVGESKDSCVFTVTLAAVEYVTRGLGDTLLSWTLTLN